MRLGGVESAKSNACGADFFFHVVLFPFSMVSSNGYGVNLYIRL